MDSEKRLKYLDILHNKAVKLFNEGKLTSHWLCFITLNIADLFSLDNEEEALSSRRSSKTGLAIDFDANTVEQALDIFSYIHDHRTEYRDNLFSFMNESFNSDSEKEFMFGTYPLNRVLLLQHRWIFTDSFFLPIILEKPYFPIGVLNKAFAHNITPIPVPLRDYSFDGYKKACPYDFALHDATHGANLFFTKYVRTSLDLTSDNFQKFLYYTWEKLKDTFEGNIAYFEIFHELTSELKQFEEMIIVGYEENKENIFNELVKNVMLIMKEIYDCDFSSAERYVGDRMKNKDIINPNFLPGTDFDGLIQYTLPGDSTTHTLSIFPYSQRLRMLRGDVSYLERNGAGDFKKDNLKEIGHTYFSFMEKALRASTS